MYSSILSIYIVFQYYFFIKLIFLGLEPGLATLKVEYVTTEPLQFTRKLFYLVNMYMIYIINGYPEPTRNRWYPPRNPNRNLPSTYWIENSFIRKTRTRMDRTRTDPNIQSPRPTSHYAYLYIWVIFFSSCKSYKYDYHSCHTKSHISIMKEISKFPILWYFITKNYLPYMLNILAR